MTIGGRPPRTDTADAFGVVVFAASAGGQPALLTILRDLPLDFDVPIVVVQHLQAGSTIVEIYEKRLPLAFAWVDDRSRLAPRTVLVCPPRACIELLPDGSFSVEPCDGARDGQIDRLLRSVARSYAHRAIGVVLTGLLEDGAAGARELHLAGGRVLVQSESSADFPDMPRAAIAAGAADFVVPLRDMAQLLTDLVTGTAQPKVRSELDAIHAVFGGDGEVATLARAIDWSRTPLGPAMLWPAELRLIAQTALASPFPAAIWWGRDLVQVYNEAWRAFLGGSKHPQALGGPAAVTWREVWDDIGPMVEQVLEEGVAIHQQDFRFVIDRHGFAEEIFATFAFSPIRDGRGAVVGVFNTCWETTQKVVAERRLTVLRALATRVPGAGTPQQACEHAATALAADPLDLPFALMYLFDAGGRQATLAGAVGVEAGSDAAPRALELVAVRDLWALQRLLEHVSTGAPAEVLLEDLARRVPQLPSLLSLRSGMTAARSALVVPLRSTDDQSPIGALVTGLSPHRPLDDDYRSFVGFVGQHIGAAIAEARARLLERERLERLAEVDRAKTEFFANVSHEFRTPLSLLLSPLEDLQRRRDELPTGSAEEIDVAARHARRLLRLVDSLLDFSQIEERRQRAVMRPTDLAALTQDVASAFRSAIERAGLALRVECEVDLPPVPVDREMWEKILSNLLSNALKFTFAGEIVVSLQALRLHVELVVSDTGVGIPKHEIPNIFKRFHRVHGAKARTIDGSGIGLAIVQDLVTRLGGQLQVHSSEGRGTEFRVWLPMKTLRGNSDAVAPAEAEADANARGVAAALADEAGTWVGEPATRETVDEMLGPPKAEHLRLAPGARILVADDNADLRDYLKRLLGAYWTVTAVADGAQALEEARRRKPDLILADVMMPNLDGFALLRAIRADEALKRVPLVFLTARAGEDTAIEGLVAGADDYIAKPFSSRELVARVGGQIALARTRRRTEELNAFLVRFSDAVRGFVDADDVRQVACRMLHEHLGVDRVHWAEIDWATHEYVVTGGAHSPGVTIMAGRFPLDAWEPFSSQLSERRSHAVDDTQADPRLPEALKAAYAQVQVGANLGSPVVVDGRLRSVLAVTQCAPRHWTDDEIALVEGVAGRCWAEVERARAEAALRESEARRTFLLELSDALRPLADPLAIQAAAARLLRERFDAGWCYYGEHDETGQVATVLADDRRDGLPSLAGRHDVSDIPEYLAALRAHPVFNIPDMATCDVFTPRVIERYTGIGVRAMLGAALAKDSGPMPALLLVDTIPRVWPREAVELISEVAERTWAAVERARTEAALRASEAHLRAVLEQAEAYAVVEVIADAAGRWTDFRFLEVNLAFMRHTGIPYPVGRTGTDLLGVPNLRWAELYGRAADTGESIHLEEGELTLGRAFDLNIFRLGGEGSRRVAVLFRDITARKRAEEAVLASERRRLLGLDVAGVGEWSYDVATGTLDCSPYARALHGVAPGEPITIELHDRLIDAADRPAVQAARSRALADGGEHRIEFRFHPVGGGMRWIEFVVRAVTADGADEPRVAQLIGAMIDVTDRRHAEAALPDSEQRFRTLFTNMNAAFALGEPILDARGEPVDYRFIEVNEAFYRHTGLSPEILGQPLSQVLPRLESFWTDAYLRAIRTGERTELLEYNRDTNRSYFSSCFSPTPGRFAILFVDVTQQERPTGHALPHDAEAS